MSINWRSSGDVTADQWAMEIPVNSLIRLDGEIQATYNAAKGLTRLCLGMLEAESSYATNFEADSASNNNALNLRIRGQAPFQTFPNWAAGVAEWKARITDPTYAYKDTQSVLDLVNVYAPSSDNNDVESYVATVEGVMARLGASSQSSEPSTGGPTVTAFPSYAVAGLSTRIVLPVPLIVDLIPTSQTNQRPGIPRQTPGFWVQHETANTNAGADAAMHNRYLHHGADGSQVSWHFTVDDHQIYQHIPITEVTWQAADGAGPGNMSGVSSELCVNSDGDKALTRRNGEALCGTICAALGLTVDQIKRHYDFNAADPNRHHCPDEMMNEGYWPQFVANAGVVIGANQPAPTPKPPKWAPKSPPKAESATVVRLGRKYMILHACTPRNAADPSAPATAKDFKPGDVVTGAWMEAGKDGLYIVAAGGSRIPFTATLK